MFDYTILMKTLDVFWARDIEDRISRQMKILKKEVHVILVGDAETERLAKEVWKILEREE